MEAELYQPVQIENAALSCIEQALRLTCNPSASSSKSGASSALPSPRSRRSPPPGLAARASDPDGVALSGGDIAASREDNRVMAPQARCTIPGRPALLESGSWMHADQLPATTPEQATLRRGT